jgi:glycine/D-amino acid oxidase-like deaminating enzyme
MGPYVDSVISDESAPAATRVVVVGGGIIGTSAALHLAARGIPVVLCEKGYIACEQSSRNWGWCRQAGRDVREMPLIVQSLRLWREMNATTGAETGYRERGVLYVGETEADEKRFVDWVSMAKPYDVGAAVVRGAALEQLMPGASRPYRCGLHVPTDGCAEPQRAAPAIATAAQRRGAVILAHCAVRGIERSGGRVAGVVTERGRIACDAVILAAGAWSSLFCGNLGLRLAQLKVLSSVLRTTPLDAGPLTSGYLPEVGYRKRLDGGYTVAKGSGYLVPVVPDSLRYLREFLPTIRQEATNLNPRFDRQSLREWLTPRRWSLDERSPFEATRVLDPAPNLAFNHQALAALKRLFPSFHGAGIVQQWGGFIDVTPDVIPYISTVGSLPGLTVATGFSGHGFGIGPAAGRLAAELAIGERASVDPAPFRFSRFDEGRPIVLGPEL